MDNHLYTVMLVFDADDPKQRRDVIDGLCKIDPTAARRLADVSQGRIIVKKNAARTTAQHLVRALSSTGAECRMLRQPSGQAPDPGATVMKKPGQGRRPSLIRCPRCDHEQPPARECEACGVIIAKARRPPHRPPPTPPKRPVQSGRPFRHDLLSTLRQRIMTTLSAWTTKRPAPPEMLQSWGRGVADQLLTCGIFFFTALLLETALLHLLKLLWYIYTAAPVGQYYLENFPQRVEIIRQMTAMDLPMLGWHCTLIVLCVSLTVAMAAQLLHLVRNLFDNQGLIVKLCLWCAPVGALSAWGLLQRYDSLRFFPALGLVAVPTLCLLSSSMQMARDAIPELGTLLRRTRTLAAGVGASGTWAKAKAKLSAWIDAHANQDQPKDRT